MEYRKLSNTAESLSVVGIGTWAIGSGNWKYGWGPQDDKESIRTIHAALDAGINWIDTAAVYGLGHAEEIIKEALKTSSHKALIATKCGLFQNKKGEVYLDISAKSIRKEIEGSLIRLGRDVIDIYQIHWPNPSKDIEEAFQTLISLKEEGKIRYPAVCNFSLDQLKRISKLGLPISLQSPYNLLRQELSYEIIPWCIENNISVLAYSPMQSGLLSGKFDKDRVTSLPSNDWRKEHKFFNEPLLSEAISKISKLKEISPVMPAALHWLLAQKGVTSAIVGLRSVPQVNELLNALNQNYPPDMIKNIAEYFS
jgi:aryl-alcohol dehydrogenase-like predicted oxidoreductase